MSLEFTFEVNPDLLCKHKVNPDWVNTNKTCVFAKCGLNLMTY